MDTASGILVSPGKFCQQYNYMEMQAFFLYIYIYSCIAISVHNLQATNGIFKNVSLKVTHSQIGTKNNRICIEMFSEPHNLYTVNEIKIFREHARILYVHIKVILKSTSPNILTLSAPS